MKKLFYLTVMLASMLWSCNKDKDDLDVDNGEGVIRIVAKTDKIIEEQGKEMGLGIYSFKGGETITIDWGDGTKEEFKTVAEYDEENDEFGYWTDEFEHIYSDSKPHTITIKGNIWGLECIGYDFISLDASKCTGLVYLFCDKNNLTSLDVSGCSALMSLDCWDNNLTSLDVSKCTALEGVDCRDNNLTSLDVSKNTALVSLWCSGNKLTATALNRIFKDLPKGKTWIDEDEGDEWQSSISIDGNPGSKTCDTSIAENKGWRVSNY